MGYLGAYFSLQFSCRRRACIRGGLVVSSHGFAQKCTDFLLLCCDQGKKVDLRPLLRGFHTCRGSLCDLRAASGAPTILGGEDWIRTAGSVLPTRFPIVLGLGVAQEKVELRRPGSLRSLVFKVFSQCKYLTWILESHYPADV
jgi:hypothetical protein